MSFNWEEYYFLAKDLIKHNKEFKESYYRSAISRAYYSAFCIARNKAGYKDYKNNVHSIVIKHYIGSRDPDERYIGKLLKDLRKKRNDADYDEDQKFRYGHAARALIKSKNILDKLGIQV